DARKIGFGWDSPLETRVWTAVKTGTSKGLRDNWCVGFSSEFTGGVWAGNFSSEKMYDVSGVSGAGPAWYEIMQMLHSNLNSINPPVPTQLVAKKIGFKWNGRKQTEYFIAGTEPNNYRIEVGEKSKLE